MREYKFRAWDNLEERMYYNVESGIYQDPDEIVPFDKILGFASYDVMQYTGLKDKNGTEIYEGDIVKFEDVGEEGYEYKEGFDFTNYASIEFDNGRWELNNFLDNNSGMLETMNSCHEDFISEFEAFEVIGNIHENPELLEGRE